MNFGASQLIKLSIDAAYCQNFTAGPNNHSNSNTRTLAPSWLMKVYRFFRDINHVATTRLLCRKLSRLAWRRILSLPTSWQPQPRKPRMESQQRTRVRSYLLHRGDTN